MPCAVCIHSKRLEIEKAIMAEQPEREIAASFQITRHVVRRHREKHMELAAIAPGGRLARTKRRLHRDFLKRTMEAAGRAGKFAEAAEFARLLAEHDKSDDAERLQIQPAKSAPTQDRSYVIAIREALGYSPQAARGIPQAARRYSLNHGQLTREPDPQDLIEQLSALAMKNSSNEKLLCACARIVSYLRGVALPDDLEREAKAIEEGPLDENELDVAGFLKEPEAADNGEADADSNRTNRGSR